MNLVVGASWCFALAGILLGMTTLGVFRLPLLSLCVMMDLFVAAAFAALRLDFSGLTTTTDSAAYQPRREKKDS